MTRQVDKITGDMANCLAEARRRSLTHLDENPDLGNRLDELCIACEYTLPDAAPSDLDALRRIGFLPFTEAQVEARAAVFLAVSGIYKVAIDRLRSLLEMSLVGVYFAEPRVDAASAQRRTLGSAHPPMMRDLRRQLFKRAYFERAAGVFAFEDEIKNLYSDLCDIVHTRGLPKSHLTLSRAGRPSFSKDSLAMFVELFARAVEVVAISMALQFPIILQPLPNSDKFGLDFPVSGFLEEGQVRIVEGLIADHELRVLHRISDAVEWVKGVREQIERMPDLTHEDLAKQAEEQRRAFGLAQDEAPRGNTHADTHEGDV